MGTYDEEHGFNSSINASKYLELAKMLNFHDGDQFQHLEDMSI